VPTLERTEALPVLKGVPLFAGLTPQQLRRVAEVGRVKLFRAGTAIVHLGEPGETFYVILDGHALVVRETGRPLKLHTGDFFGELALIENAPRSADVIATDDVTALAIGHAAFQRLLRSEAAFTHAILKTVVRRLRNDQRAPRWQLGNLSSG
jgi:CRP/FNR family transcriptional regulator, cyclic AMP receptor protein